MTFTNSIVGQDGTLIRDAIQSEGFSAGTAGWRIERTGDAEFNEVVIRGDITIADFFRIIGTDPDAVIEMSVAASRPVLDLVAFDGTRYRIAVSASGASLELGPTGDPNSRLHFVDGEGIALRSSTSGISVLFDDDDGFLKRGTYSPWVESGWTNVSLQNSWVTTGVAAFDDPSFKRSVDGRLWLRGAANGGTKVDGTLLFTLPAGHRPASLKQLKVSGDAAGTTPVVQVETDGEVRIYQMGASNAWVLDEVSFSLI